MASQKRALKNTISKTIHIYIYWYNLTKAKHQFKKPKDTFGVELSDFENFKNCWILSADLPA